MIILLSPNCLVRPAAWQGRPVATEADVFTKQMRPDGYKE
jgi:hypothetical protein